jgi:hypothetical protein
MSEGYNKDYAALGWNAEDVQTLRPDLTDAQAEAFLARNERHLRDRLVELGWDVMDTLLALDDEIPKQPKRYRPGDTGHG